mmetsp:Transcript_35220/g.64450  ORF Transcript_35220/g.64450 Transcript_35220/m.64450 type:complete len:232 (-) Transcript_35220:3797-4492(-)
MKQRLSRQRSIVSWRSLAIPVGAVTAPREPRQSTSAKRNVAEKETPIIVHLHTVTSTVMITHHTQSLKSTQTTLKRRTTERDHRLLESTGRRKEKSQEGKSQKEKSRKGRSQRMLQGKGRPHLAPRGSPLRKDTVERIKMSILMKKVRTEHRQRKAVERKMSRPTRRAWLERDRLHQRRLRPLARSAGARMQSKIERDERNRKGERDRKSKMIGQKDAEICAGPKQKVQHA